MLNNTRLKLAACLVSASILVGCGGMPEDALKLSESSLQKRQQQSKRFDMLDEVKILAAASNVLQDMGFILNESDSKIGVLVGSKQRETDNKGQRFALITLSILAGSGSLSGIESEHVIRASLVTLPDTKAKSTTVRVNFQREVIDMTGQVVKREPIAENELYTGFFSKLSKSVFLEAHEV